MPHLAHEDRNVDLYKVTTRIQSHIGLNQQGGSKLFSEGSAATSFSYNKARITLSIKTSSAPVPVATLGENPFPHLVQNGCCPHSLARGHITPIFAFIVTLPSLIPSFPLPSVQAGSIFVDITCSRTSFG